MTLLLLGAGASSGRWLPTKATTATLLQWLYDGAATPIEQTSEITGSPMTVVNDRANTGDRRELRPTDCWGGDDAADYLVRGAPLVTTDAIPTLSVAFEAEFVSAELNDTLDTLAADWNASTNNRRWMIYQNQNLLYKIGVSADGTADVGASKFYAISKTEVSDGRHTLGFTFTGGTLTCYLDGVDWSTLGSFDNTHNGTVASILATASSEFMVGNRAGNLDAFWPTDILSGIVTTGAMTAAEHLAFHESHALPASGNIEALYWLEEGGTGSLWLDASGNGNHLRAVGTSADQRQTNTLKTYSAANSLGHSEGLFMENGAEANYNVSQESVSALSSGTMVVRVTATSSPSPVGPAIASWGVGNQFILWMRPSASGWALSIYNNGSVKVFPTGNDHSWGSYLIAVTFDGTEFEGFVNGVSVGTIANASGTTPNGLKINPFSRGGSYSEGNYLASEFRMYGSKLSGSQVADVDSLPESPVNHYLMTFSAYRDQVVVDRGSQGNDCTIASVANVSPVIVPRDESDPTKDVTGAALQYSGSAPRYGQAIQSGALQGDGGADVVDISASLKYTPASLEAFSLSLWLTTPPAFSSDYAIFGDLNSGASFQGVDLYLLNSVGKIQFRLIETLTASELKVTSAAGLSTSTTYLLTITYDGSGNASGVTMYVDGASISLNTNVDTLGSGNPQSSVGLKIFSNRLGAWYPAKAWNVAEWSVELSAAQTLALWQSATYPADSLEALYPCSNITANGIVPDVSGNGRHGVISGVIADVRAGRQDVIAWNQLHGFDVGFQSGGAATTDYVSTAVTPNASGSVRFKGILSNSGVSQGLFGSSEAAGNFWVVYYDSGGTIRASLGGTANVLVSTTTFANGDYVDVEIFWNDADGSCSMNVNGIEEATGTYTSTVGDNSQNADLGAYYTDGTGHSEPWNGILLSIVLTDTDQSTIINSWTKRIDDTAKQYDLTNNHYISSPPVSTSATVRGYSTWVKFDAFTAQHKVLREVGTLPFLLSHYAGQIFAQIGSHLAQVAVTTSPVSEWLHVTYLRYDDDYYFYLNGVLQGTRNFAQGASTISLLAIGADSQFATQPLDGSVGDVCYVENMTASHDVVAAALYNDGIPVKPRDIPNSCGLKMFIEGTSPGADRSELIAGVTVNKFGTPTSGKGPMAERLLDSVGNSQGNIKGTGTTAIIPGLNGIGIDGNTATTYAPGATADKFLPDGSQIDRTGGVSHPDANINNWDETFESGDTQTNPEFVRNNDDGDDRFLGYSTALTDSDLTKANNYTT